MKVPLYNTSMTEPATKLDPAIAAIRDGHLGTEISRRCGISRQAIYQWDQVPWNRVHVVAEVTGLPPHVIRPDIYPPPPETPLPETRAEPPPKVDASRGGRNRKVSAI